MGIRGCESDETRVEQRPGRAFRDRAVAADERRGVYAEEPAALGERANALGLGRDRPASLGMRQHRHEARSFDQSGGLGDGRDWVVELEPEARKLDQHRAGSLEHELGRVAARDLAREHLPAATQVESPAGDLHPHLGERGGIEGVARIGPGIVIPGGVRMRRCEQDLGAGLVREAAERQPFLDRVGAVVTCGDDVSVDVDESGHASTLASGRGTTTR